MITAFTAFLFNILANLSRRILRSELSKLTQRVQMAECDEIDLNRRIKELTDENSKLIRAGLELSANHNAVKADLEHKQRQLTDEVRLHSQTATKLQQAQEQIRIQNNALEAIRNALNYLDRQQQPGTQEPKSWSPKTAPKPISPIATEQNPPSHLADILDRLYPDKQSTQS